MNGRYFPARLVLRLFFVFSFFILTTPQNLVAEPAEHGPVGDFSPRRVVSLVPAATEIIRALNSDNILVGVTIHDVAAEAVDDPGVVGGFLAPSLARIIALEPDLIILADLHREVRAHFQGEVRLLEFKIDSLRQAFDRIEELGANLGREEAARLLIGQHRADLTRLAEQLALIPAAERRRMMRLMSTDPLAAPGDDSFQNDFIRAAGGIPPVFGQSGHIIALTPQEIQAFDPQLIYVCGEKAREGVFNIEALQAVDAVRNRRVLAFPCELTCRAGVNIGSFVFQLAAGAYEEQFQAPDRQP